MTHHIAIRRAAPEDAPALAAIGAATFTQTFGHLYPAEDLRAFLEASHGVETWRADLADPRLAIWLAQAEDGQVVGYMKVGPCALPHPEVTDRCGELKTLYLLQPWQGAGNGGRLFETGARWLAEAGYASLWVGVWSENHGARRFYERRGLQKVGEYGFPVGRTVDLEFIMRGPPFSSSDTGGSALSDFARPG